MDATEIAYFSVAVALIIGSALWMVFTEVRRTRSMRSWPTVMARVVDSQVETQSRWLDLRYNARIHYEYSVPGLDGLAGSAWAMEPDAPERGHVEKLLDAYPIGSEILIAYDPQHPTQSRLADVQPRVQIAGIVFAVLGAAVLMFFLYDAITNGIEFGTANDW